MSQTEIEKLIRALDEWEVADDRANEATAAVGRSGALNAEKFEELRALERVATQKLEQVRSALAGEIEDNRLLNGRWYAGADAATGKGK